MKVNFYQRTMKTGEEGDLRLASEVPNSQLEPQAIWILQKGYKASKRIGRGKTLSQL